MLHQARLNNSEFATVALCAVEHPSVKPYLISKLVGNVSINDLLRANEAGAQVGTHAWRLIKSAVAEDCREKFLEACAVYDPPLKKTRFSLGFSGFSGREASRRFKLGYRT